MNKEPQFNLEKIKNSPTLLSQLYRKYILFTLRELHKTWPFSAEMAQHYYQEVMKNPNFLFARKTISIKDIKQVMWKPKGKEAVLKKLDKIAPEDHLKIFEAFLDSAITYDNWKTKSEFLSQYFNKFKFDPEVMIDTLIQKEEWYRVFEMFDKFKSLGISHIVEKFIFAKQYKVLLNSLKSLEGEERSALLSEILKYTQDWSPSKKIYELTFEEETFFIKINNWENSDTSFHDYIREFSDLNEQVAEIFPLDIVVKNLKSFSHLSWDFAKKLIKDLASDEKISSNYEINIDTKFMKNLSSFDVELNQVLETMMETESLAYILAINLNYLKPLLKWEKLSDEFAQKLLDSQSDTYQKREVLISISKNASLFDSWKKWEKAKNLI